MKPRTLARIARRHIKSGKFVFDCEERKKEALRQIKELLNGESIIDNNKDLEEPITEFHIGVYTPNFDYPLVPTDSDGEPIVWEEDGEYMIPGKGTHVFRGVGLSGEYYHMGYLESLAPYRDATIKVDTYTSIDRAAYAFLCTMTRIIDKKKAMNFIVQDYPIKIEQDMVQEKWCDKTKNNEHAKDFEEHQRHLYVKWLQKWISLYGTNPKTHVRQLKMKS